jgi:hypothetical protein
MLPRSFPGLGRAALVALALGALVGPTPGFAQNTAASELVLGAGDLGRDWSATVQVSPSGDPKTEFFVTYGNAAGRLIRDDVGVAASPQIADQLIANTREVVRAGGATITPVEDQGLGDGLAFQSTYSEGGNDAVSYMFRVHELYAVTGFEGPTGSDVAAQASQVARKQDAKLRAAVGSAVSGPSPTTAAPTASTDPHCQPGQRPAFGSNFADLSSQVGAAMGTPVSCEYADPAGSGDTLQATSTGLAIYRRGSGIPTFTNGSDHWALVGSSLVTWTGTSVDPPDEP